MSRIMLAVLAAAPAAVSGQVFNAGYENHTVLQIAHMVRDVVGSNVEIDITATDDNRSYHISSQKIRRELGLFPARTIKDAVHQLVAAFGAGKIPDWQDENLYNVRKMKSLQVA